MNKVLKAIVTLIVGTIVLFPCMMIFNESDSLLPNLFGIIYIGILILVGKYTKLGNWCVKKIDETNEIFKI